MSLLKTSLPQEGTGRAAVGESLPASSGAGCPTVSGGGKNRHRDASPLILTSQPEAGSLSEAEWVSVESLLEVQPRQRAPKRGREGEDGASAEMPAPKAPKAPIMKAAKAAKKGGRPKSTLSADARRELVAAKRDEAEKAVAEMAKKAETLQASSPADKGTLGDQAATNIKIIREIAAHSGNLKGTFQKGLKDAAASLEKVMSALSSGSTGEEAERLRVICERMEAKVSSLEKEVAQLRAAINSERPERAALAPAPLTEFRQEETEVLQRLILSTMSPVLDARFEGLQDRLLPAKSLRPALAADKRRTPAKETSGDGLAASVADMLPVSDTDVEEVPVPAPASRTAVWRKAPPQPTPEPKPKKGKGKRGRKGKGNKGNSAPTAPEPVPLVTPPRSSTRSANSSSYAAVTAAPASRPTALPPAPGPSEEPWKKVPEKGARRKSAAAAAPPRGNQAAAKKEKGPQPPKLRPPRSAAVVIRLRPDAEKRGATYGQIMDLAMDKVDLGALGIPGVKFKKAATGARILEIAGTEKDDKANLLASKLKEVLDPQVAEVSRPLKSVDVRVLELCDSATPALVCSAIARAGQCPESEIRVGDIREDRSGVRTAWVRCPIAAAKRLTANGTRLLVGWVSAQVKLLPARPMQCFRCLETGHVSQRCTAESDRSLLCYRCGEPGHKAAACNAAPKCILCAGAGKPTGHRVGSKACSSTRQNKKRRGGKRGASAATAQTQPARAAQSAEVMETGAS
ncbi:uncharacterized protein LOC132904320 [Amyelois transitella]|uniref:uncharacterized protein LOC132904182 n=1 Tax=Amyelois transitella TaxID=680683 RepID=UPI0029903D3F|nr:uncharacterized protein LOC132904182 [Amyelois transitella]XP_060810229.1 uncharacterized protein LOC132904320 [Amyelois transitella]